MACNSCAKSFSLLRKEKGCPNCGFSYCSNCLNNKVFLPKINCETKVCAKCNRLTATKEEKDVFIPPDAYYKRLAATEEKSKNQQIQERLQKLKKNNQCNNSTISTEDIAKRLQIIKGNTPSTEELESRLAKLRGMECSSSQTKTVLPSPDARTEQEQADDLMRQYIEQTKIDSDYKKDFDGIINVIETRVQKLKGSDTSGPSAQNTTESQDILNSEDEDEALKKIIEKVKAQSLLEHLEISTPTNDELPFCEICNEDARMRCLGCRYLFCKRCFLDHKDDDDGCNRYEPYTPPENC